MTFTYLYMDTSKEVDIKQDTIIEQAIESTNLNKTNQDLVLQLTSVQSDLEALTS